MKHKKLIIVISIILFLIIAAAVVGLVALSPILTMTPAETGAIEDSGITSIKNQQGSVYFYDTGDGYLMIDTGSDGSSMLSSMNELSIKPDDIKYVFITHTDSDHMATIGEYNNAQIYMNKNEKQMIDGTTKRSPSGNNDLPGTVSLDSIAWLENGEKVELNGHTVECIDAHGHTTGSMAYLLDERYLFTGDAFKVDDYIVSVHPFTMDEIAAEESISNLESVFDRSELVLTSHYGYFQADELK